MVRLVTSSSSVSSSSLPHLQSGALRDLMALTVGRGTSNSVDVIVVSCKQLPRAQEASVQDAIAELIELQSAEAIAALAELLFLGEAEAPAHATRAASSSGNDPIVGGCMKRSLTLPMALPSSRSPPSRHPI